MFDVRIEEKPTFTVMGRKAWIPIEKGEDYDTLFQEAHGTGLIEKLMGFNNGKTGLVTNAAFLGVARIYGDPSDGKMDYYIAAEVPDTSNDSSLEHLSIPASKWAIVQSKSVSLEEMRALEIYGYTEWLPGSGYKLTSNPQMNAFLRDGDRDYTELWLPITENKDEMKI